MRRRLFFAKLSDEVRCATADFTWRCLETRGRSREEFVDLVSRQNILDDEKVAECFEKGKSVANRSSAVQVKRVISATSCGSTQCTRDSTSGDLKRVDRGRRGHF
jgi:hypothetical protein